ncbi:HAD-IIIC family phosphatase [Roseomonas sp. CCTCC AB2023176]|uniref:HAD-IIIC family phosphatase n=1 Tax=Roseomonas sp. CCTCC AB2023176 TaxID=3342640 RepID=UPI0035D78DBD
MPEPVRLVIWDLDETFWSGTLTEGGIRYNQAAHDTVIELSKRGIISSICSKNDFAPVEALLRERGIWEYFVFPSVNWEPKGPRIAALIEAIQLRPETVLFVDDNHLNLKEAQHFVPGLQVAAETFVPDMLASPLMKGKDDRALTRLNQYKLLEKRKADEVAAAAEQGGSNIAFLRSCNVYIRVERNIEKHIDRAIELINRTNQLNFTKLRLPEDPDAARAELRHQLEHHMVQAGLIEVSDKYGNYGYCGFYMLRSSPDGNRLVHFCFSCRILNMGVEGWTYQRLGQPDLAVRGAVLSDPVNAAPVDWITLVEGSETSAAQPSSAARFTTVAARGGCVLMPLMHYFGMSSPRIVGEFNIIRDGITVRLDHTLPFRHALEGIPQSAIETFKLLGYREEDFRTDFFAHAGERPIYVFSNWADLGAALFRHKATGVVIPFKLPPRGKLQTKTMRHAAFYLKELFEPAPPYGEEEVKENLRAIFSRVPPQGRLFALLAVERHTNASNIERVVPARVRLNRWTTEVAREFPNVTTLRMEDFIQQASDVKEDPGFGHFDRMVYLRVYQDIVARMADPGSPKAVA